MAFTFVHTADWQIGKPFRSFPEKLAGRLEDARLKAIDRIADVARAHGATHVLVAGDVYDGPGLPLRERRQPLELMRKYDDLAWVLLPGNHDPATHDGIWNRVVADGLPDNVHLLLEAVPFALAPGVVCLPAPLHARAVSVDPSAWLDDAATPEASVRIGQAHGSVRGFGSADENSVEIDPLRAKKAGLSYLALGDWHGMERVNARTWYSGTPETDRFRDNEPGYVLVVKIDDPLREPEVTPVRVGHFVWAQMDAMIFETAELALLDRKIAAACDDPARVLLRLGLEGHVDAGALHEINQWREAWDAKLVYLNVEDAGLVPSGDLASGSAIGESSELAEAARQLEVLAAGDDPAQAKLAARALKDLLSIAQSAFDEAGA